MKDILKKIWQTKSGGAGVAAAILLVVFGGEQLATRYITLPSRVDEIEKALKQHRQVIVQMHGDQLRARSEDEVKSATKSPEDGE